VHGTGRTIRPALGTSAGSRIDGRGHMAQTSHYDILDVSPAATPGEIRAAYRRLVTQVHPDAGGSKALFRLVQEAYDAVSLSVAAGVPAAVGPRTASPQHRAHLMWSRALANEHRGSSSRISLLV